MWFGDLVTMRWWDDLWLNESFAEWASHHAMARATRYTEAWTTLLEPAQDLGLPAGPAALDPPDRRRHAGDLETVKLNFDGITYAKGASALRQLVAWVGEEEFLAGLRAYFQQARVGQHRAARPARRAGERPRARPGGLDPAVAADRRGEPAAPRRGLRRPPTRTRGRRSSRSRPPCPRGWTRSCAATGSRSGSTTWSTGRLTRTEQVELDVVGRPHRACPQLVGRPRARPAAAQRRRPHLRQDPPRRALLGHGHRPPRRSRPPDGPRAGLGRRLGHDPRRRDGRRRLPGPGAVRACPPRPTSAWSRRCCCRPAPRSSVYAAPEHRDAYLQRLAAAVHADCRRPTPAATTSWPSRGRWSPCARTPEQLDAGRGPARRLAVLDGLAVDTDLRWSLLGRLVAAGRAGDDEIDAELARDDTATGGAAPRRSASATPDRRGQGARLDDGRHRRLAAQRHAGGDHVAACGIPDQRELLRPFRDRYFEVIGEVWATRSAEMAGMVATALYPGLLVEPETVAGHQRPTWPPATCPPACAG